jgi:hypothetical protein
MYFISLGLGFLDIVRVHNSAEFVAAARDAKPGRHILLEPGEYKGGVHIENLHGTVKDPIVIDAADPKNPPVFVGGGSGIHFSKISYVDISNLNIRNAQDNGLNIDDGGVLDKPSQGVILENIRVTDLPAGNHDGIKLSGVVGFIIEKCTVEKWGGSAIDMVGCRNGSVSQCTFKNGGSNGIQMIVENDRSTSVAAPDSPIFGHLSQASPKDSARRRKTSRLSTAHLLEARARLRLLGSMVPWCDTTPFTIRGGGRFVSCRKPTRLIS